MSLARRIQPSKLPFPVFHFRWEPLYALYKDILPESKPEFDYKHESRAECGKMDRLKSDLSAAAVAVDLRKASDRAATIKMHKMLSKLPHRLDDR